MIATPAYLSAEQLLEKVWDENTDPFTKIVTVTVSRLRHKLGEPGVIGTVPRVGYRLMPVSPTRPTSGCSGAQPDARAREHIEGPLARTLTQHRDRQAPLGRATRT